MAVSIGNSKILGKKMLSIEGGSSYEGKKGTIRRGGDTYIVKMMTDDPTPVAALDAYPKHVEQVSGFDLPDLDLAVIVARYHIPVVLRYGCGRHVMIMLLNLVGLEGERPDE